MRVGYARVSTADQSPGLQLETLRHAGCEKVFTEKASGAKADRPELARLLRDVLRQGDVLVVWKLDRLARVDGVSEKTGRLDRVDTLDVILGCRPTIELRRQPTLSPQRSAWRLISGAFGGGRRG